MSTAEAPLELDDAPVFTGEFAALLAATLAFGLAHSAYFLLPKYLAVELHASASEIGWISSLTWFANVALVAFVGVWIDRRGRLVFAYLGAALLTLTCLGFLFVDALGRVALVPAHRRTASRSRCSSSRPRRSRPTSRLRRGSARRSGCSAR